MKCKCGEEACTVCGVCHFCKEKEPNYVEYYKNIEFKDTLWDKVRRWFK